MKNFEYYSDNKEPYHDSFRIKKQLIDQINNEPLTVKEREEKLKEVTKEALTICKELNAPYHLEAQRLDMEFWDDARESLGYVDLLTAEGVQRLESKAYEDGHAYGYPSVYEKLQDLVEFLEEYEREVQMSYSKEEQKKNRAKWVAALRSGEYKQCRESLKRGNCFCVNGVAVEVFRRETGIGKWEEDFFILSDKESNGFTLPATIVEFYGLTDNVGTFISNYIECSLMDLNDYDKKSFQWLADFIESNPEGLFVESPTQS